MRRFQGPSVLCPICGEQVTNLASHLAAKHPVRL